MVELIRAAPLAPAEPAGAGAGDPLAGLAPGRLVRATVVGPEPGGLTLIRLMGQSLLAESRLPLVPGQALDLVVQQTKPQLVLALAPEGGPAANPLTLALQEVARGRQRLAQELATLLKIDLASQPAPSPRAGQLAASLQAIARQMLLDGSPAGQERTLSRLACLAGLDLEARLAELATGKASELPPSLRAITAALAQELEPLWPQLAQDHSGQAALYRELLSAGQGLAAHYEATARLNAQLLPQALYYLGLPLGWQQPPGQGELLFGLPDPEQDQAGPPTYRLVFFLSLAALGPLAIEVTLRGQDLTGVFITDDAVKSQHLAGLLPGLASRLAALGYQARLSARARPGQDPEQASPLAQLIRRQGGYISLRV